MASVDVREVVRASVRRVLLVDDYEPLTKQWTREFSRLGIEAIAAANGDAAVEAAKKHEPDVAIVDLFLTPPETGIDVIERLKAVDRDLYCILVSAHMSVAYTVAAMRAGANDVYFKPFTAKQVLQRIEQGPEAGATDPAPTLEQIEWEHISRVLLDHDGNITRAADSLGLYRQSLQRKIHRYAPRALRVDRKR